MNGLLSPKELAKFGSDRVESMMLWRRSSGVIPSGMAPVVGKIKNDICMCVYRD
ncbi:hypothetical protein Hanom_Chr06g00510141 [Helianthus anomalus]